MSDINPSSIIATRYKNKVAGSKISGATTWASSEAQYNVGGRRDTPDWVAFNEFRSTYYSGLDISVYAGGIFLDEVIQLQFSEMEQVRPLFGYYDYTFRDIVHGSRIVQGSFSINFKDSGYIPKLMERLRHPTQISKDLKGIAKEQYNLAEITKSSNSKVLSQNLDNPAYLALSRDLTLEDIVNTSVTSKGASYNQKAYSNLMNGLRGRYWNKSSTAPDGSTYSTDATDDPNHKPKYSPPSDMLGFDLVIKYGQPEDYEGSPNGGRPGWGTLEVIKDCNITGFSKSIDDSGRNILETYQFLARCLA